MCIKYVFIAVSPVYMYLIWNRFGTVCIFYNLQLLDEPSCCKVAGTELW